MPIRSCRGYTNALLTTCIVILSVFLLYGCTRSLEGTWVSEDGTERLVVDEEWMNIPGIGEVRYKVDGKTSVTLTQDGRPQSIRWSIEGNALTLGGSTYLREGSPEANEAAAARAAKAEADAAKRARTEQLLLGTWDVWGDEDMRQRSLNPPFKGAEYRQAIITFTGTDMVETSIITKGFTTTRSYSVIEDGDTILLRPPSHGAPYSLKWDSPDMFHLVSDEFGVEEILARQQ